MRADEFDPERVDEFGPVDADEDVVPEAEELKHVPAPISPSKAVVESHNVSHLPFRSWCSACVRGRGPSLVHRKVDTKTQEAEQIPTVWQPEDRAHDTHFQCSSCEIARVKASGVTLCIQLCDAPVSCKGSDGPPAWKKTDVLGFVMLGPLVDREEAWEAWVMEQTERGF